MFAHASRLTATAIVLGTLCAGPSAATERGAFIDLTPTRALRLSATRPPEIPGVTYPNTAPPDLLAHNQPAMPGEPDMADEPEAQPEAREAASPETPAEAPAVVPAPSLVRPPDTADERNAPSKDAPSKDVKPAPPVRAVTLKLDVDLATQQLTVAEHGTIKHVWPISSGRAPYATKTGTFRPQWAARMWYSRQYDMAPMPHSVFFNGGIAFHATQATHLLGRPASHGCVRLSPKNARALYEMIHAHGFAHTEIVVAGAPKVASVEKRKARVVGRAAPAPSFWPFF